MIIPIRLTKKRKKKIKILEIKKVNRKFLYGNGNGHLLFKYF